MAYKFIQITGVLFVIGCYQSVDLDAAMEGAGASNDTSFRATDSEAIPAGGSEDIAPGSALDTDIYTPPIETVCNGADDDGNGIIDDVDQNRDGICDCLNIAVLGNPGEYGTGDLFETWLKNRSQLSVYFFYDRIDEARLRDYDILIVQDISLFPQSDDTIQMVKRWVDSGGGLMTLCGYHGDAGETENVNRLLSPHGIVYGPENIMGDNTSLSTRVTEWMDHPLTEGVLQVGMKFGRPVVSAGTIIAVGQGPGESYARVLGRALEEGEGRVFAWADEWITYESEWVDRDDYQVQRFWRNILKWLAGDERCRLPIESDD